MRLFMRCILGLLFLLGVALCGLSLWPAGLAVWQGKILLDKAGLAALSDVLPVLLAGVATCAATAIAIAQLDRVGASYSAEAASSSSATPAPQPATPAASPATVASSSPSPAGPAGLGGSAATARRTGPNPLK